MPVIEVNLFEGRTVDQKRRLIAAVTEAVAETLGVPGDNIRIIVRDLSKENFGVGGKTALDLGR